MPPPRRRESIIPVVSPTRFTFSPRDCTSMGAIGTLPRRPPHTSISKLDNLYAPEQVQGETLWPVIKTPSNPSFRSLFCTLPGSASIHPLVTVTQNCLSKEQKSSDSSPNHSQMSRNSSKKSNNSLLVHTRKLKLILVGKVKAPT